MGRTSQSFSSLRFYFILVACSSWLPPKYVARKKKCFWSFGKCIDLQQLQLSGISCNSRYAGCTSTAFRRLRFGALALAGYPDKTDCATGAGVGRRNPDVVIWRCEGLVTNFGVLVLGCIEADICKYENLMVAAFLLLRGQKSSREHENQRNLLSTKS